jgi:tetratricopeptide (TPR) repeat protein
MQRVQLICALLFIALVLSATHATADDRNLLPKYGSLPKAGWQKASDDAFIAAIDKDYKGNLKQASKDMAARGWQYLYRGNPDDAMRRFNQAWLLDSKNGIALWGMAAIEADREKYEDSIQLFREAEPLVGDSINFSVDYARVLGVAGAESKNVEMLNDALNRFEQIYLREAGNGRNLKNWAYTLFKVGRYGEAWEKVKLAEAAPGGGHFDPKFLRELQKRMPRP